MVSRFVQALVHGDILSRSDQRRPPDGRTLHLLLRREAKIVFGRASRVRLMILKEAKRQDSPDLRWGRWRQGFCRYVGIEGAYIGQSFTPETLSRCGTS